MVLYKSVEEAFEASQNTGELNLSGMPLPSHIAKDVGNQLAKFCTIKIFSAEGCDISDESLPYLIDGLLLNPELQVARFNSNYLTSKSGESIALLISEHEKNWRT